MRKKLLLFLGHFLILCTMLVTQSHASSITPGYDAVQIQPYPHVLYDGEMVQGLVQLNKGVTVLAAATGTMDTCLSVSGAIDLRDTGILKLLGDLYLDSSVTLSGGGSIKAHGNTIFMSGDLTLPPSKTLNFTNNAVIDGRGHDLIIDTNSQISLDPTVSVTLKNMNIKDKRSSSLYPPIILDATTSQLTLDNVILAPVNDFNFLQGQLFIKNDVIFTGTSALVYKSTMPCRIAPNSCLYFDTNTSFNFAPYSNNKDLLAMTDATSSIYLNGCDLKTTYTGLRLTKGRLICDNKINFDSQYASRISGFATSINTSITSLSSLNWSPDGQYLAIGRTALPSPYVKIYSFYRSSLTEICTGDYASFVYSVNWSPDGRYLAIGGAVSAAGIQVYSFNGTNLTNLGLAARVNYGGNQINSVNWSPNGQFLALGGEKTSEQIKVYSFNGSTLSNLASCTINYGAAVTSVNWSPNGNYLAICGKKSLAEIKVYSFNGSALSEILSCSTDYGNTNIASIKWSPDGNFLAVGGQASNNQIKVYYFTGTALQDTYSVSYSAAIDAVNWSPDGQFLATGGRLASGQIKVFYFNGTSLSDITGCTVNYGANVNSVDWKPDGQFLAAGSLNVYPVSYAQETQTQTMNNTLILGNKNLGSTYNLQTTLLGGCNIEVNGLLNDDSV